MIHAIIVRDPTIFQIIQKQIGAKKVPLSGLPYQTYAHGNIRMIGEYHECVMDTLISSVVAEFNPDTVFFLSESLPVSDEKLAGDIVLPNVFFEYDNRIEAEELGKEMADSFLSHPIFLEHYPLQGDYNFESFGLSVGGIHVSGEWNTGIEDFRIRLRVVYENDTFDSDLYTFVKVAQEQKMLGKTYPVTYTATQDQEATARNLWSIVGFIVGSIDPDLISDDEEPVE